MPGPIAAAGAVANPTKYAALTMGARQFTGLWTQRSPYRDAAVEYLVSKFYSGSRFDSILDGINREISARLTDIRSPGSSVYNANTFPPALSFYSWKYIQDGAEVVRVLEDGTDGVIYDATAGQKSTLATKAAGAGPARFLGVNTELFFGDGVEQRKVIGTSKTWQPNTVYNAGDLILDSNGNLQQMFSTPLVLTIESVQQFASTLPSGATNENVRLIFSEPMDFPSSFGNVALAGLTGAAWLNGTSLTFIAPIGTSGDALQGLSTVTHADYPMTPETGTATGISIDASGTSGATPPVWQTGFLDSTVDGTITWRCYKSPVQSWGIPAQASAPDVQPAYNTELYWEANTGYLLNQAIRDANGQIEVIFTSGTTGFNQPAWSTAQGGITMDGEVTWINCGTPTSWLPNTDYTQFASLVDSNGNLQIVGGIASPGESGTTVPVWATARGSTTTDNDLTWINCGPGTVLSSGTVQYASSVHSIDGSVTTASPVNATVVNGVLGKGSFGYAIEVSGTYPHGPFAAGAPGAQVDQLWLWRTAQGQPTLILLAIIPVDPATGNWVYYDYLPDTQLNAFIAAPVAESADPPPLGFTAPVYYLQRIWGIVDNVVMYSGGPDTTTGNGNTTFPPLNEIPYASQPVRLVPVTVQNGGLLVFTTDGVWIILGTGTASNPFYTTPYYSSVDLLGYNALDVYNNSVFVMESNGKVSTLAIEYPFNPQTGYTEVGFPIGDQFEEVTTGGITAALYDPATAYLSWNIHTSSDTGMYVADGAIGWFRMSILNQPETGLVWNPRRGIVDGTSAVQSVETAPGVHRLLIGPPAGTPGPILVRDTTGTVFTDNGNPYASWDDKGVNLLCSTGQWAETVHISTKSAAVGVRPIVSVLLGEVKPSPKRPFRALKLDDKSNDPARSPKSQSVYSDRYVLKQSGINTLSDCLTTRFDYGTQNVGDELLDWGIYARVHDDREEQVASTK
jgi:hypothetical protein